MTLLAGDLLAILLVTLFGFVFHGESIATPRWLTTFFPVLAAWALYAPWLGLYLPLVASTPRQAWWRAGLAAMLAAPLAGLLRALWLGSVVVPVFVLVLAANAGVGMALWRLAFAALSPRLESRNG